MRSDGVQVRSTPTPPGTGHTWTPSAVLCPRHDPVGALSAARGAPTHKVALYIRPLALANFHTAQVAFHIIN